MNSIPDAVSASFHTLYPEIVEAEIASAAERFQRYIRLALDVAGRSNFGIDATLTAPRARVNVLAGQVDPTRTFTNTG
jgi:hypothetical protein